MIRDAQFARQVMPTLVRLGVGLSEFGERTFLLDALPPFAKVPSPRAFVVALLDELKEAGEGVNTGRFGEDVVARTVCRHAVKAHDRSKPSGGWSLGHGISRPRPLGRAFPLGREQENRQSKSGPPEQGG